MSSLARANRVDGTGAKIAPGQEPGQLGAARRKLLDFLRASSAFNPKTLLAFALQTSLHEEVIILYEKLERHRDVLLMYVHKLADHRSAAEYCMYASAARARAMAAAGGGGHASEDAAWQFRSDLFIELLQIYFGVERECVLFVWDGITFFSHAFCSDEILV